MKILPLDLAIIIAYFILVIVVGLLVSRGVKTSVDYFLAGRTLKWPFLGASLFATNISAEQFVGQAGLAFVIGISVANYQLIGVWAFVIMGAFFLPVFLRLGMMTTPQFFAVRYGLRSKQFYSALSILTFILNIVPVSLYAGGTVTQALFGFPSIVPGILILGVVAGGYSMMGGLRAVVITDAIQVVFLLLGGVLVLFIGLDRIGGWSVFIDKLQLLDASSEFEMLKLMQPIDHQWVPWTGVVLGLSLHSLHFCSMNHDIVQRSLAAKSIQDARLGGLMAAALKLIAVFIIVVPGLVGYVLVKENLLGAELSSPDQIFPLMVQTLLPVGVTGLVLAGLMAALMSSIDSNICGVSSLVTLDWFERYRPNSSEQTLVRIGRWVGAIVIILGMSWAIFVIPNYKFLFDYFAKFISYSVGGVLAVFLWGLLSAIPGKKAALVTLIGGTFSGFALWMINDNSTVNRLICSDEGLGLAFFEMHFLHASFAIFVFSSLMLFGATFALGESGAEGYAAIRANPNREPMPTKRENRIYAVASAAVVAAAICVYLYFS